MLTQTNSIINTLTEPKIGSGHRNTFLTDTHLSGKYKVLLLGKAHWESKIEILLWGQSSSSGVVVVWCGALGIPFTRLNC